MTQTREEICRKVTAIAADTLYPGKESNIKPEDNLRDEHGADSLDQVDMVMKLEKEYQITIPDVELERLRTVSDFTRLVETKLKEK